MGPGQLEADLILLVRGRLMLFSWRRKGRKEGRKDGSFNGTPGVTALERERKREKKRGRPGDGPRRLTRPLRRHMQCRHTTSLPRDHCDVNSRDDVIRVPALPPPHEQWEDYACKRAAESGR